MSSFVISKNHYIRVAGLLCGLSSGNGRGDGKLYVYNEDKGRKYIADDWKRLLTRMYIYNVQSVADQYDEPCIYDEKEYADEFKAYFEIGKNACVFPNIMSKVLPRLARFTRSVSYQIEDSEKNAFCVNHLNSFIVQLYDGENRSDDLDNFWGGFEF